MVEAVIIWHIGGGDSDIGPITQVCNAFPKAYRVVTFEAQDGACVDEGVGKTSFYVNKHPLSSGLLPPNPRYAHEVHTDITWGENTELEREIEVRTTTLDVLRRTHPQPDVLSIDCQGAELRIMRGGAETLHNVLCVVAEAEFVQIYDCQCLFDEQMAFLRPYGFRLMDLFGSQQWHPGKPWGRGLLTVAEVVWIRDDHENLTDAQLETLAMIMYGFGRLSYGRMLLERLQGCVSDPTLAAFWEHRDNPALLACAP